jgi:hypothetical protein
MQGVLMGTPSTMAPEQFNDPDGVDFRADIYGLGCVLYQALTGMPAFASNTLGEILSAKVSGVIPNPKTQMQDLPRGVCDLVTWMLARDRAQRPQTYHELIARCDELAADPTSARRGAGSRAPLIVGAIGAVIAAGVAVAVLFGGKPPAQPVAPATPTTAPASTALATAMPAFGDAVALVPEHGLPTGWETHGDAGWAPSEEHPGALSGHHGIYLHALEPEPLRIEATLHPGSSTLLAIGVAVGDEVVAASVKSLTASFYGSIDSGTLDKPGANLETGLQSLPASKDVAVVLTVVGKTLTVEIGGHDLKPISLAGVPTHLVLDADGVTDAPAEVGHLTVRYAK